MKRLARSTTTWWVLLGVAATVVVGCSVLLMTGSPNVAPWFTMFGSTCTIVVCVINIRTILRADSRLRSQSAAVERIIGRRFEPEQIDAPRITPETTEPSCAFAPVPATGGGRRKKRAAG